MKSLSTRDTKRRKAIWRICILLMCMAGLAYLSELFGEAVVGTVLSATSATGVRQDNHLNKEPYRQVSGLQYERGGMVYDCMECHRSLKAKWHLPDQLMEHGGLKLNHGSNRFCLNCHHPENRNVYVDYDGTEIVEKDHVLLCGKCHGPQHRDWIIGAHGRRNGYWDTSLGLVERLSCIQCHDPHDPAFKPMKPLSAPSYPSRAAGQRNFSTRHQEEPASHDE